MSFIKKINFFNFYNSFINSGYLYLYIFLFIWHLDHALWMQYLLFLHSKNELQILKSILISALSLSFPFFLFFFSIILHKDFPPVSANPWVLTYLRMINYYNIKGNCMERFAFGVVAQRVAGYSGEKPSNVNTFHQGSSSSAFSPERHSDFLLWDVVEGRAYAWISELEAK